MRFLIHQHKSNRGRLTYYLRLEKEGVFRGWAIPKGMPKEWKTRHLAIQVGDLKLNKYDSEGKVEKGKFGPGIITIQDRGEYRIRSWEDEKIIFDLAGSLTKGSFALVLFPKAGPLHWLLGQTQGASDSPSIKKPERTIQTPEKIPTSLPNNTVPANKPTVGTKKETIVSPTVENRAKPKSSKLKTKTTEWRLYQTGPKPKHKHKLIKPHVRKPTRSKQTSKRKAKARFFKPKKSSYRTGYTSEDWWFLLAFIIGGAILLAILVALFY